MDKRGRMILDELLSNPGIASADLENSLNLSRRQLGYSLDKINEWLIEQSLSGIERTRKGYFLIDQSIYAAINGNFESGSKTPDNHVLTDRERTRLLLLLILSSEDTLSLNHFTSLLKVSKNTVLNDFKKARTFLEAYELKINYTRTDGYIIEGREFQTRKLLIHVIHHVRQMSDGEARLKNISGIHDDEVDDYLHRLEKVEAQLNLKFTDEKLATMPYVLILIHRRIRNGYTMSTISIEYEELSNTKEYKATEELLGHMENVPVTDRLFITLHLLTANVFSSDMEEEEVPDLAPATDQMLRHFEKNACIYLQDREQLMTKLLQHIKPAYYRIKYRLTDTLSLKDTLSQQFEELHLLVKRAVRPLETLIGEPVPDNETAYITMLIGGWMYKHGESIERKVKAIVVCPQGVSVSRLMFNEMRELFPEFVFLDYVSVREMMDYPLEYDIVFSPVYLDTTKHLFVTKVFLGKEEKQRLRKQVMMGMYGYSPNDIDIGEVMDLISNYADIKNEDQLQQRLQEYFESNDPTAFVKQEVDREKRDLAELLPVERINIVEKCKDWKEAFRLSAEPLLEAGRINESYVESMIDYAEKDSYIVIGPNLAIPHASPEDGATETGMSLLCLKEEVPYTSEYRLNFIVTISAVDKQQHINALTQLMKLASSTIDMERMLKAESIQEIHTIIQSYSG